MQDNHIENKDAIEKLLKEKFGALYDWIMPVISKTVGPYSPEVFTSFEARRTELIDECKNELEKNVAPSLANQFHPENDDSEVRAIAWENLLSSEISELSRRTPNWMLGGFGHPDFEADFEYWGQMAAFELDEALLLSVGIEPRYIGKRVLDSVAKKVDQDRLFPAMEYLAKRRVQFRRHFPSGYNGWHSIRPSELKSWFDEVSLEVHKGFYVKLERRVLKPVQEPKTTPEQGISSLERETLLKLIAAVACEQYGFDPSEARNNATSSLKTDLGLVGLSMDDKTILKWLREAAALVPKEYWGNRK